MEFNQWTSISNTLSSKIKKKKAEGKKKKKNIVISNGCCGPGPQLLYSCHRYHLKSEIKDQSQLESGNVYPTLNLLKIRSFASCNLDKVSEY